MRRIPLLLLSIWTAGACRAEKAQEPPPPVPVAEAPAPSAAVKPATAIATVPAGSSGSLFELSGVAQAARTTRLSTKSGGILRSIKTREGERVTQGQVLCQLDVTDLVIRHDGAAVALAQAEEAFKSSTADLKRAEGMKKGGAMTDSMFEKAELANTMAKLQADAARVAMRAAEQAVTDATLRAPFGGVITKVLAEEGQMITTMPPTVIFVLVDTSTLEVRVQVPERMLARIKQGSRVQVTMPALNFQREAKVDRIPEVVDPATRSVEAVIKLDNKDHPVPAGLFSRIVFSDVPSDMPSATSAAGEGR